MIIRKIENSQMRSIFMQISSNQDRMKTLSNKSISSRAQNKKESSKNKKREFKDNDYIDHMEENIVSKKSREKEARDTDCTLNKQQIAKRSLGPNQHGQTGPTRAPLFTTILTPLQRYVKIDLNRLELTLQ